MYQVIGILRKRQQRLLATPKTAREALQAYFQNIKDYGSIVIHSPSGETIEGATGLREIGQLEGRRRLGRGRYSQDWHPSGNC